MNAQSKMCVPLTDFPEEISTSPIVVGILFTLSSIFCRACTIASLFYEPLKSRPWFQLSLCSVLHSFPPILYICAFFSNQFLEGLPGLSHVLNGQVLDPGLQLGWLGEIRVPVSFSLLPDHCAC